MTPTDPAAPLPFLARIPWQLWLRRAANSLMGWFVAAVFDTFLRHVLSLLS
ncbi:hypothetical protein ACFFLM_04300 [Deinococcus oregonensis]|uniref:MFS transporter n=1 Tax=Deinococcus oregonensis TaxID=1805970 RepID=A0ABV6AUL9_9DEIO